MPLTTPTVPLTGDPDVTRNGHVDRRAASRRQAGSVTPTAWPTLVTRTAYDQLAREGKVSEELASLRVRRLCMARCALGRAKLALDGCMHDHRPGQPGLTPEQIDANARVWQELRRATLAVEKAYVGFPLEVRG